MRSRKKKIEVNSFSSIGYEELPLVKQEIKKQTKTEKPNKFSEIVEKIAVFIEEQIETIRSLDK